MHVAVVGAGALGSVYGARLASASGIDVSFVVRSERAGPLSIEQVETGKRHTIESPRYTTQLAPEADIALLCVSATDLDHRLTRELSEQTDAPIVSLTPLLPREYEALLAAFGKRLVVAMPSVTAYRPDSGDAVRYWLPRVATTLVEEPRPLVPVVDELVRALSAAGIATRLQIGTSEINAATTVTFLPLAFALDVAGTVDALLADEKLVALALEGASEGKELGHALGKPAPWAELLVRFIGPLTLRLGIALAKKRSPEGVAYVEQHFGRKMHPQNVAMAQEIAELARDRGLPHRALAELAKRARER